MDGVLAGLRAEVAGLRAALDGLRVVAPAPALFLLSVVYGLMPCALEPEAYIAAFGALCLHVLHLHDVPAVRDVVLAGKVLERQVEIVVCNESQPICLFRCQRCLGLEECQAVVVGLHRGGTAMEVVSSLLQAEEDGEMPLSRTSASGAAWRDSLALAKATGRAPLGCACDRTPPTGES